MLEIKIHKDPLGVFELSVGCQKFFLQTPTAVLAEVGHYIQNSEHTDEAYRLWKRQRSMGEDLGPRLPIAPDAPDAPVPVPVTEPEPERGRSRGSGGSASNRTPASRQRSR